MRKFLLLIPVFLLSFCKGQKENENNQNSAGNAIKQVIVYHETGRFAGWPANNGAWIFDNDEILVGFTEAPYVLQDGHNIGHPQKSWLARSTDGGLTWEAWDPENYVGDFGDQPALKELEEPIDFGNPNFAMRMVGTAYHGAKDPRGHFFYTYDGGRTWKGPYGFGDFQNHEELTRYWEEVELTPRTDYLVTGSSECLVFMSARPKGQFGEDRMFCIKTSDGGKSFQFHGWIVRPFNEDELQYTSKVQLYEDEDKNPWSTQCRAVMSESFMMDDGKILSVMRRKYSYEDEPSENWVDAYISEDGGKTWLYESKVGDAGEGNGNPPSLARTDDGRFCAVFGERKNGTIRVAYSEDNGRSWGDSEVLYDNYWSEDMEYNDLGYPRIVSRSDGKMVAIFYYSTKEALGQIHATIFQP